MQLLIRLWSFSIVLPHNVAITACSTQAAAAAMDDCLYSVRALLFLFSLVFFSLPCLPQGKPTYSLRYLKLISPTSVRDSSYCIILIVQSVLYAL